MCTFRILNSSNSPLHNVSVFENIVEWISVVLPIATNGVVGRMARRTIDQRIAELEEQARALKARKATTERANDTRRTVVLGSLVLQEIDKDTAASKALRSWLSKELPEKLTRDRDREIFAELLTKISRSDDV